MKIRDEQRAETVGLNFPALLAVLALILIWVALIRCLAWLSSFPQTLSYLGGAFLVLFVLAILRLRAASRELRRHRRGISQPEEQLVQHRQQNAHAPTTPPKAAATFPLPSHTSRPSARPQPRALEQGVDWRDFAPLAGILCVFAAPLLLTSVFNWTIAVNDWGAFLSMAAVLAVLVLGYHLQ
jgi:uncharacterized membrane protein